jgi:hypothetical protein
MERTDTYGTVKLARVKAAIKQIEDHYSDYSQEEIDNIDITFEYLVGSFFPTILKNIDQEVSRQHAKGFAEGLQEGLNWGKNCED